ncbi:MAG TPA: DUF2281 domain-containing protein [Desulfatiglandales bacterium]|nr:DUF2281 domain-containing protein [Desulfatiglandales bacterium]
MTTLEKIVENLKTMPESVQTEVLDYVNYLKFKEDLGGDNYNWGEFSLNSAMRGIAEEPSPYGVQDIKEKF